MDNFILFQYNTIMAVLDENPFLSTCKNLLQLEPNNILYGDSSNLSKSQKVAQIKESDYFVPYEYAHPHLEICFCLSGEVVLRIGDIPCIMRAGQMMIIPPGISHCEGCVFENSVYRVLWLTISDFSVMGFWCEHDKVHKWRTKNNFGVQVPSIRELRRHLCEGKVLDNEEFEILRDIFMLAIIKAKVMHFKPSKKNPLHPSIVERHLQTIDSLKAYIETHFAEKIDIKELTLWSGLSQCYCYRLFRARTGLSINAFQVATRMNHAKKLLKEKIPVKTVAYEVGYDDPLYFSKVYKKFFGHPPSLSLSDEQALSRYHRLLGTSQTIRSYPKNIKN